MLFSPEEEGGEETKGRSVSELSFQKEEADDCHDHPPGKREKKKATP